VYRIAYVYWLSLAAVVVSVLIVYLLMRSRTGLALTAVRDEPTAASSLGVRVERARRIVWVSAGAGCGVVGALLASSSLRVQPDAAYSVNYTAFAIFMVVLGGIGTIEGPILGACSSSCSRSRWPTWGPAT
jgi:branched-chain amino acid transport system permease protein